MRLAAALRASGHAVRGTTRDPGRRAEIAAAGAEPYVGDPDRVATLTPAFAQVGIACVLLGCATGTHEHLAALHSTRLEMLVDRMLDTTVRAIVYEAAGSVDPALLRAGSERVRGGCERSLIPYRLLTADPADHHQWLPEAHRAVEQALLS